MLEGGRLRQPPRGPQFGKTVTVTGFGPSFLQKKLLDCALSFSLHPFVAVMYLYCTRRTTPDSPPTYSRLRVLMVLKSPGSITSLPTQFSSRHFPSVSSQ